MRDDDGTGPLTPASTARADEMRTIWSVQSTRAVRVTALVLGAALIRAALTPVGEGVATAAFAAALLGVAMLEAGGAAATERRWGAGRSLLAGVVVAGLLVGPGRPWLTGGHAASPLAAFWSWAAITALVATLEEVTIRGALQRAWTREAGPLYGIAAGAAVFAAIHLPRYGLQALPLDLAVGIALGALRAVAGRVLPCAIAHTVADWAAWWMA